MDQGSQSLMEHKGWVLFLADAVQGLFSGEEDDNSSGSSHPGSKDNGKGGRASRFHPYAKGNEGKGNEGKGNEGKGNEGKGNEGKGKEGKGKNNDYFISKLLATVCRYQNGRPAGLHVQMYGETATIELRNFMQVVATPMYIPEYQVVRAIHSTMFHEESGPDGVIQMRFGIYQNPETNEIEIQVMPSRKRRRAMTAAD